MRSIWSSSQKIKLAWLGEMVPGKSTFLKILAGELKPDNGDITKPGSATLAFLHQDIHIEKDGSVIEEAMKAFEKLQTLQKAIDHLNHQIATRTDYESESYLSLLDQLSEHTERFALLGGESAEGEAVKVLKGLGFKDSDLQRPIHEFSGGWQMRVILAKMLLKKPDFLLLDEPTNHLDIESIIWLEKFISNYAGAVIIVSHDQQFLDNATNRTVEIELGRIQDYRAPYSKYLVLREDIKEKQLAAYENQQKVIAQKERTINRFMAKATKTKMAQSMQKQLDKLERIEIATEDTATMNIQFPPAQRSGQVVVAAEHLSKSYGDLEVLKDIKFLAERNERIAFVGQNGQGKTTLARILVEDLAYNEGDLNIGHNVHIGYYAQNQAENLDGKLTLLETMELFSPPEMRTKLRKMLGAFMFSGEDVDKKVSVLSGGERARLAMACMLLKPINFLVLDEPTNHLDILSKEVLKDAIGQYDGTLIVVSHDRHFLSGLTDKTYEFRDRKIFEYLGDVNYFLQKRQLDTMREVELHKTKVIKNQQGSVKISQENQHAIKQLERKAKNIESKIERIEQKIGEIEKKMAVDGFYESVDYRITIDEYENEKSKRQELEENWEEVLMEIEKLES